MAGRDHWEEEKLEGAYDARLMRRLLRYVYPYWRFFLLSFVAIIAITAADLALPYLIKTVIDRFISLPHAEVVLPSGEKALDGAIPIEGRRFLVEKSLVDAETAMRWKKEGVWPGRSCLVVERSASSPEMEAVVAKRSALFRTAGGIRFIDEEALASLAFTERMALRAPALDRIGDCAWLYIMILIVHLIFTFIHVYILGYVGQRIMSDMRMDVFSRLMTLPVRFYDRNPVGRLVTRATNDVAAINEMVSTVLVTLVRDIFLIIGILVIMFSLNVKLAAIMILLTPALVWLTLEFRRRARAAYREVRRKLAKLNALLAENIAGMRIIQLFARESASFSGFTAVNNEEYRAHMTQLIVHGLFQPVVFIIRSVGLAIILWYGGAGVLEGEFTIGAIVAFVSYVEMLFRPISDLAEKYNVLQGAMAAAEKIFALLDEKPEEKQGKPVGETSGRIEFRDVWFSYGEGTSDADWVLKGVSFVVEPGRRMAIVGPTGSGKTTMISLLLRFYNIRKGQILLDGTDIREFDLGELRSRMGVVLQDVFLFSESVLENIRLGDRNISPEKVIESARFVQADEFVRERTGGYDAGVGERGGTLSVGERQLLAFARAVAFDPKILILDEATANIDSRTEHVIQETLHKLLRGRTSLIIAHRLSTVREADGIIVLHRGRIVEQGNHQELLARKGLYHALYTLQFAETGIKSPKLA